MSTGSSTGVPDATQEVLVRTRASDTASVEHGNAFPVPEQLTARFQSTPTDTNGELVSRSHSSPIKTVVILLVLAGIGVAIYHYVYPYLVGDPSVLQ